MLEILGVHGLACGDLLLLLLPVMQTGTPAPLIADDVYEIIARNAERLDAAVRYERDFECVAACAAPADCGVAWCAVR